MKTKNEFDYTAMSTFMTCRRKYDFRMNAGIVGKVPSTAPEFGRCIHLALDVWYKAHDVDAAVEAFKKAFVENPEDSKRTHKMGEWIIRNYHDKYQDQPFTLLSTEQQVDVALPNGNRLIGRIDKIIEWDGAMWVVDHKTTSMLGPTYMRMHTPNMQFDGYTWAAQNLFKRPCAGVLVDAILVAKGLLESASRARLTPLLRDFAYRSPKALERYVAHAQTIQADIRLCEEKDEWCPNYDACTYYGECPYRKICLEDPDIWNNVIKADYIINPWTPKQEEVVSETT